jgi:hypothetical protein
MARDEHPNEDEFVESMFRLKFSKRKVEALEEEFERSR